QLTRLAAPMHLCENFANSPCTGTAARRRGKGNAAQVLATLAADGNDLDAPAIALAPGHCQRACGARRPAGMPAGAHVRLRRDLLWPVRFWAHRGCSGARVAQRTLRLV